MPSLAKACCDIQIALVTVRKQCQTTLYKGDYEVSVICFTVSVKVSYVQSIVFT